MIQVNTQYILNQLKYHAEKDEATIDNLHKENKVLLTKVTSNNKEVTSLKNLVKDLKDIIKALDNKENIKPHSQYYYNYYWAYSRTGDSDDNSQIYLNKAKGALASVFILAILLLLSSSIAILQVETDPRSNIKTAEDALWWSYTTITTVGYGDLYPVTAEGRLIAIVVMTFGVGLFGTFTAYIASVFVKPKEEKQILIIV